MRRFRLTALFVVVLAAAFAITNAAFASNGATTAHFIAVYENVVPGADLGHFTCAGERIVKTGPKAFVKDSEICTITNAQIVVPDGNYPLPIAPTNWFSDYEALTNPGNGCQNPAISGAIDVTNNGSTWTIVAYYDPAFICP